MQKTKIIPVLLALMALSIGAIYYLSSTTTETPSTSQLVEALEECEGESVERIPCWERVLDENLSEVGLNAGFDAIIAMGEKDPTFSKYCHDLAHKLGEEAYRLFNSEEDLSDFDKAGAKTHYCGYGFYHGFVQVLMISSGDISRGGEFCNYVKETVSEHVPGAADACYHGISHGFTENFSEKSWEDINSIIAISLENCEAAATSTNKERLVKICSGGVFHAIYTAYHEGLYTPEEGNENPFHVCSELEEKYKWSCYIELVIIAMPFADNDLEEAVRLVEKYVEPKYIEESLSTLISKNMPKIREEIDEGKILVLCRSLTDHLRLSCIEGLGHAIMAAGVPEKEYLEGIKFCTSSLLLEDEKHNCSFMVVLNSQSRYPTKKMREICATNEALKLPCTELNINYPVYE